MDLLVAGQYRTAASPTLTFLCISEFVVRHLPQDALVHFNGLRSKAMTPEAWWTEALLGPWAHLFPYTTPTTGGTGDIDFGPNAWMDLHETQLRWFDYWLKGIDSGLYDEPPIRLFVMGANQWRDEYEWPLARTRFTPYYLHSQGKANTLNGNGALSPEAPVDEPADHYRYDPADPAPTCGGNTLIIPVGVKDQREVERRQDVLVYTGAPLEKAMEVTGPIKVCCTHRLLRRIPTSRRNWLTCGLMAMRRIWRMVSYAHAIASPPVPPNCYNAMKCASSPSTCGRRVMCSCQAIASEWKFRRAIFRASIAISTPVETRPRGQLSKLPNNQCSTMREGIGLIFCCR